MLAVQGLLVMLATNRAWVYPNPDFNLYKMNPIFPSYFINLTYELTLFYLLFK